jgi:hypothetical protein
MDWPAPYGVVIVVMERLVTMSTALVSGDVTWECTGRNVRHVSPFVLTFEDT